MRRARCRPQRFETSTQSLSPSLPGPGKSARFAAMETTRIIIIGWETLTRSTPYQPTALRWFGLAALEGSTRGCRQGLHRVDRSVAAPWQREKDVVAATEVAVVAKVKRARALEGRA